MNWRKINRRISVYLIGAIQGIFLFMIFRENPHSYWICAGVVLLSLLVLTAHVKIPLHHEDHLYENILVALWLPVGAVITFYFNNELKLGPVIAAGIVGTCASLLPGVNKRSVYWKQLPAAIYCGAFIGMSSLRIASGFTFILIASFFAGVLLVLSKSLFLGMGGKLGLIAFAGVIIASFGLFILSAYAY